MDKDEDRIKQARDIYDQFIMRELLAQCHVSFYSFFVFYIQSLTTNIYLDFFLLNQIFYEHAIPTAGFTNWHSRPLALGPWVSETNLPLKKKELERSYFEILFCCISGAIKIDYVSS